jgi:N-acetylglucosaminyldiphosphoundecaprenol N-acetyl-beta-D-mannosaminyltransferase
MHRVGARVLSAFVDAVNWPEAIGRIRDWADSRDSRYVCITNVHSVVTAGQDTEFGRVIAGADMVTPDGAPVAWMLRKQGYAGQERINGPDLMWRYFADAQARSESIFLYGGAESTLEILQRRLAVAFPRLKIAGAISPPFRDLAPEEDRAFVAQINASGAGTVWVSLGCPKQEKWMAEHRGHIKAVMIGVGAAFDYHAGTIKRAPLWMQQNGLEWLHRLCSEPGRLWKRYFVTNTLFIFGATKQLVFNRCATGKGSS